ncbi:helix-turn-helix transcriptional regulator [Streptomyces sp. NBC_01306]|uniref:helix-turn-helix domain-containing protein n=1 Tax=Streptomyces sp. NBC_01306 TaxID=2903819 RepID=UPI002258E6AE|nr:helix-turn-helix transcriptional regulator [Streptomyces sp. NBC_01306]MCX4723530.1 helix-turn-helix domain-containing protein [Streptomyces sp. NBC_01306]
MHPANKRKKNPSWHLIGAQLRHFHKRARLTQPQLADEVNVHVDTIASIEQGRRPLQPDLADRLDRALDTGGALGVGVEEMPGWERFPAFAQDFIDYEEDALPLLSYQNQVIPGLLQTEGYAHAVIDSLYPPISSEQVEERVAARIDRQRIFDRRPWPPMMNYLIEEVILTRPLGGSAVLNEQLRHLRRCAELPFLGLQIVPTRRGRHAGLDGPMVLLETPEHHHLVYLEGQRISVLVDDPDEVSIYQQKYGMLRSQALTPEESLSLLDDPAGA